MKTLSCLAVCAILIAMPNAAVTANLTGNPSFEIAGGGGATDSASWIEFSGGPLGTTSERDGSNPFSGSFAHRLLAEGDATAGASAGINQNSIADVGLPSLQELTSISATFQWAGNLGPGGVAFGALRVLNGSGAIVGDSGLIGLPNTGGAYQLVNLGSVNVPAFGAAPNDVYAAFIEISVASGAFDGSFAEGFVDDVNVQGTTVPEPTSALLIGLASVGLLARRRRS